MTRSATDDAVTLGLRVKSGWAAFVVAQAGAEDPRVLSRGRIELCDPHEPDSRQPYHAGFGTEQHDTAIIGRLVAIVERCARDSVRQLVVRCRQDGMPISSAGLVVGSDIDPATIANPHIRAHASEGRLFRRVAEDALREAGVPSTVWVEKLSEKVRKRAQVPGVDPCSWSVRTTTTTAKYRGRILSARLATYRPRLIASASPKCAFANGQKSR